VPVSSSSPTAASHPSRTLPSWAVKALKLAFSAGLLWLLFSRIDAARFWAVARQSSMPWLAAALVLYAIVVFGSSWRWHRLLVIQQVVIPLSAVTESFLVSLFFNNFLPSNIGGDVIRVRDTARSAGPTRAVTVIVADRVAGLLSLFLFAAVGGAMAAREQLPFSVTWIWLALAAALAGSLVVLVIPSAMNTLLARFGRVKGTWLGAQLEALAGSMLNFRAAPAGLVGITAMSIIVQASFILVYAAVAEALGAQVGFFELALVVPLAGLIQLVPVSINGFGIREAAFTVLFGRFGVPAETALLISLEVTALVLAVSLVGALAYVLRSQAASDSCQPEPAVNDVHS
jgi:uncharacterized protein (TIRG00374 family)